MTEPKTVWKEVFVNSYEVRIPGGDLFLVEDVVDLDVTSEGVLLFYGDPLQGKPYRDQREILAVFKAWEVAIQIEDSMHPVQMEFDA